jgi:hypothetical protein
VSYDDGPWPHPQLPCPSGCSTGCA